MDALSSLSKLLRARPLLLTLASRFIIVAALPILAVALLFRLYYEPLLLEDVDTRQGFAADNIARQLERHFAIADRELGSLARLFDSSADLSEAQIQTLLDAYADTSDFYEAIYLSDAQGRIRAIGIPAAKRNLRQNLYGLDVSARDFVRKAQAEQTGAWSNSFLSTVSSRLAVALARPLGQRTLIGEVAISPLPELARQLSQDGALQVLIVDRQRQLIASSQNKEASQQLNLGHLPVFQSTGSKVQRLQIESQEMVGLARTVSGPDWQVLVAQPSKQAYALLGSTWQRLLLSLAATLALALAIAALTSWSLANKISLFSRQVRQIANGSYDLPMQTTSISELNTLSASLKRMVGAIREREEALLATAQSLRESEDRLLATLENTPNVAIQWFDAEGRVVLWNHASETLYGIDRDQALGQKLDTLFYSAEQQRWFVSILEEASKGVAIGPYLSELRLPDKRQLFILATTFVLPSSGGQQMFVCMDIDVTDQKKAEIAYRELNASLEQRVTERTEALSQSNAELSQAMSSLQKTQKELVQSEKLAALGSLVAGIAHELNTPVGNSLMAASTLEDHSRSIAAAITGGALKRSTLEQFIDDNQTATDILVRNLRKASELITSFKQVAVDQASAQRRHFQLSEVVKEILITLGPTLKKTPFVIESNIDDSISLDSYPGALGQVLVNLINNALIHGLQGLAHGKIGLHAFPYEPGWIELALSDNGHGIDEGNLPRIFDPFYTTRLGQGGSGLGLNIVHNLVTGVLGGKLEVASQPGRGARFAIRLPICAPSGEAQTLSAEPSTSDAPTGDSS
ncbi:MAG: ATP-binding protein [Pseudomonas sp.]|nr:ATP-binding protein [Pseudomonas sp.]